MIRRNVLECLAGAAAFAGWPSVASAANRSGKPYRIAYLTASGASRVHLLDVFRTALRELGYEEGQSVSIFARFTSGRIDELERVAAEIVTSRPDVIAAVGTPAALAAKRATATIPIIFSTVADAVATGLVGRLSRPDGNATGVTTANLDTVPKRLELLKELSPGVTRTGLILHPDDPSHVPSRRASEEAAKLLGLELQVFMVRSASEVAPTLERARLMGVGALVAFAGLTAQHHAEIAEQALKERLPSVSAERGYPQTGGLASYASSYVEQLRRSAAFVDKVLRGAQIGQLPVEQPTSFELILNVKTARMLGTHLSESILLQADEIID